MCALTIYAHFRERATRSLFHISAVQVGVCVPVCVPFVCCENEMRTGY